MNMITGVTYPVPKNYMSRFLEDGKTVFIKPATAFKELKEGMKLVFYQSHEDTGYVGEATIEKIEFNEDPNCFFDTYGDSIFLTREEVHSYLSEQDKWNKVRVRNKEGKKKKWIAIKLTNIQKYPKIKKPDRFVPVGGKYLKN